MVEEIKSRWVQVTLQTKKEEVETLWRIIVKKPKDCPGDGLCATGPITDGKYMIKEQCPDYKQNTEARNRRGRMEIACTRCLKGKV